MSTVHSKAARLPVKRYQRTYFVHFFYSLIQFDAQHSNTLWIPWFMDMAMVCLGDWGGAEGHDLFIEELFELFAADIVLV